VNRTNLSDAEWRSSVEEYGFAIIPNVLNARELIPLSVAMADLVSRQTRAGIRHVLSHPAVKVIAQDQRLLGIAQSALGNSAFPFRATLFDKSPESNWLITWHQDTALPLTEKRDVTGWGAWSVKEDVIYAHAPASVLGLVLALRLHLDDSTDKNGPLRVLPGTHQLGVLSDDQVERETAQQDAVECLVPRGGVIAMRPLIIHASSKSKSKMPRRVLHIEYSATVTFDGGLQLATT
jgi:ectoine hydroxylase-related dioxygenase (phytanoyl-CoA dioxygenase family)